MSDPEEMSAETPARGRAEPIYETEAAREFAAAVARRHVGLLTVVDALAAHPRTPGEAVGDWATLLAESADTSPALLDAREVAPVEPPPGLREALQRCQKPFQLWNVNRIEDEYDYELEPGPELRLGGAAELPTELQVPRRIEKATRALSEWIEEQEFEQLMVKGNRRRLTQALREPLPFGKPDEKEGKLVGGLGGPPPGPGGRGPAGRGPGGPGPSSPFPGFGPPPGGPGGGGGSPFPGFGPPPGEGASPFGPGGLDLGED